jgi:hypothetical protein
MTSRLFRSAFLFLALTALISRGDPPARLAIVSDDGERDLAALVATELSSHPDLVLLERDDLAKVGDEAKVQQLAGSDAVTLGKLVGADGLLFLAKQGDGTKVRLTSVSLGYALLDEQLPANADLPTQAKSIAHRIAGYAAPFKLTPAQAIPISVLTCAPIFRRPVRAHTRHARPTTRPPAIALGRAGDLGPAKRAHVVHQDGVHARPPLHPRSARAKGRRL